MKYNHSLDYAVLALQAASKGRTELAAKLFTKAVAHPDLESAMRIIEASNAKAFEVEAASKKAEIKKVEAKKEVKKVEAKPAAKRIKASEEGMEETVLEDADGAEDALGADLVTDLTTEPEVEDEVGEEETLAGDFDELEDVAGDDDTADEFAAVLASMRKASK